MSPRELADAADALDVLRWWAAAGVDTLYAEAPRDRLAERPAPARAPALDAPRSATPIPPAALSPPDAAARTAAEWAAGARTLDELREAMLRFEGCALKKTATQLVFADGAPGAAAMIVGEAPGADEDRIGRPFVGRAGQLLDLMLAAVGLDRRHVYIANVVPWRPPGNRTPTPQEVAICRPFIARQIELADPDILVCLGGPAAQSLLGSKEGIMRLRGRWHDFDTGRRVVKAIPMLHPAYLLRQPAHKKLAWADLRALRKALDGAP